MAKIDSITGILNACKDKKRRAYRKCVKRGKQMFNKEQKTAGKINKWDALETGYIHGIDGRASVAQAASSSISSVSSAAASIFGGGGSRGTSSKGTLGGTPVGSTEKIGIVLTIIAILVAIAQYLKGSK